MSRPPVFGVLEHHRSLSQQLTSDSSNQGSSGSGQSGSNATPLDMFVPEPVVVPVIGGKRAPDKYKSPEAEAKAVSRQKARKGVKKS